MKPFPVAEILLIEEVTQVSRQMKEVARGLSFGALVKLVRQQLGMSQQCLARRAGVPQSTVSRLESGRIEPNLQTVSKILQAMACDFVIAPLLQESVELLRRKQARKLAEKHVGYLRGTMSLEKQKPDAKFIETLLKQEEEKLLRGPNAQLWME